MSLLLTYGFETNRANTFSETAGADTNSALAPHCGIGSDIAGKQQRTSLSSQAQLPFQPSPSQLHQKDSHHVFQSRSPFLQCLPPTGCQHRQAHHPKTHLSVRCRDQCHPSTKPVPSATTLELARRSQDRSLLGSYHEVGSRPCWCRRLCSSR